MNYMTTTRFHQEIVRFFPTAKFEMLNRSKENRTAAQDDDNQRKVSDTFFMLSFYLKLTMNLFFCNCLLRQRVGKCYIQQ